MVGSIKTIAAIATGMAPGGVGIVRLSGGSALAILRQLCPLLPSLIESHRLYHCNARNNGGHLDDVLAVWMRAPGSYTGEDVVEIHGHGGLVNMRRLLDAVLEAGASMAGPGEFTQRAFLNGRMDLTQAEAVIDVIHARSEAALKLAHADLSGRLGQEVRQLREEVAVAVTLTEAAIDFSAEEHVYQLEVDEISRSIETVLASLNQLLGTYDSGRRTREGVRVVFVGSPNAGKSTLFNALCGHNRAIVTPTPGTTRDYLEESLEFHGVPLHLVDTAGLRQTDDEVERIGVERTLEQVESADVLVWVIDRSQPDLVGDQERAHLIGREVIAVLNKSDLPMKLSQDAMQRIEEVTGHAPVQSSMAQTEALHAAIVVAARRHLQPPGEGAVIARARHRQAMERAHEALVRGLQAATDGLSHEFIALDLRLGLDALGEIVGHVSVDDVLNRIFSEFCVGK